MVHLLCSKVSYDLSDDFPCDIGHYKQCIGRFLPGILKIVFKELGFNVEVIHQQSNGVDIRVYSNNKLVIVIEVLNWSIKSYLNNKRRNCIIQNLKEYDCNRLLIYTNPLSNLEGIKESQIQTIKIGYQILRKPCYTFFLKRGQSAGKRFYSDTIKKEVKSKILEHLDTISLESNTSQLSIFPTDFTVMDESKLETSIAGGDNVI